MKKAFNLIGVSFLDESKQAAGYPVCVEGEPQTPKKINTLGSAKSGSGHDCFLKGITVQVDVAATSYQWMQTMRYHWFDFVSSQSKMYSMTKFDIAKQCTGRVDQRAIDIAKEYIEKYKNKECDLETMLDNIPQGFLLTARMTTNYLQLKTMYNQRKSHKLKYWQDAFVNFCSELPEFFDLIGVN